MEKCSVVLVTLWVVAPVLEMICFEEIGITCDEETYGSFDFIVVCLVCVDLLVLVECDEIVLVVREDFNLVREED